jgi:TRAP transporter TAXI family solute receptor
MTTTARTPNTESAPPRNWEGLKLAIGGVLLLAIAFFVAYRFVSPAPPSTIRLASGQPDGAYALFAEQYRAELALEGIEVELVSSTGSLENLERLIDGQVDVALVQAGVADMNAKAADVQTLGAIFHEPLWVFVRAGQEVELVSELAEKRLELGSQGSGTRALATRLLAANGIVIPTDTPNSATSAEAIEALVRGQTDVLFLVAGVDSPAVRSLFENSDVALLEVTRAEAYTRLDRTLSSVLLPRGVIDLERDIPTEDTTLVATVAEIVIGPDFHPVLVDLMLQAANRIHRGGDVLSEPDRFPTRRWVDLPLSPDADRYFEYGPPFLQRYLPFWAATQIDRLKVMLIPLIALLVPLIRIFPPTYRWRVRSRIYRWYRELRAADPGAVSPLELVELQSRLAEVDRIEAEAAKVPTPTSYAEELYSLRLHIEFVRRRIEMGIAETSGSVDEVVVSNA